MATTLRLDGALVPLDGHGRASLRSAVLGVHILTATVLGVHSLTAAVLGVNTLTAAVIDGGDEAAALGGFTVLDDSGAGGPTVSLTAPVDGDSVTAPGAVTGSVADDDLAGWRLQLADHDGHPPITVASGVAAIDGTLGTLDPTRLQERSVHADLAGVGRGRPRGPDGDRAGRGR